MDFSPDPGTAELYLRLSTFLEQHVYPAESVFEAQARENPGSFAKPKVLRELQATARGLGLWNLFLPEHLTNLQYAPLAELTGRSPLIAPEAINCNAPDSGNMELLSAFATPEQRERWLQPLLRAEIRSAFCMTEPDVASSDPTSLSTRITRVGEEYEVTGRKWFASGAMCPDCTLLVVMGVSDPDAEPHRRHSMILIPRDAPGMGIVRNLTLFGYEEEPHGGRAEITFDGVRVPASSLLGEPGAGFAMAQARLGPGRIHHCMRLVGMAERALELMCRRASSRSAFGRPLGEHGMVQHQIASARVAIDQLRLLVLRTAWLIDTQGAKAARREISAIKIAAPRTVQRVVDDAVQVHGAAGVTQDTPLAMLWTQARGLRIADGPDEVHITSLARHELRNHPAG